VRSIVKLADLEFVDPRAHTFIPDCVVANPCRNPRLS
jgi:hypothetical protein